MFKVTFGNGIDFTSLAQMHYSASADLSRPYVPLTFGFLVKCVQLSSEIRKLTCSILNDALFRSFFVDEIQAFSECVALIIYLLAT